jgi:putative oxidoreductase
MAMDIALLALRVVVGLVMAGHGAQKLFGSFGGHGLDGTAGFMESLGMRPGRRHATAAGAAELAGGLLLVLGLATPLGSALIIAVMVVAIAAVHAPKGPWVTDGGYEYNAVLIAVAFGLAGAGPGEISLDDAIGWMPDITGTGWAFIALGAGVLGGIAALVSGRAGARRPARSAPTATPPRATSVAPPSEREDRFGREPDDATIARRERPGTPADPR